MQNLPCTICPVALGNFFVNRLNASAGMTASVVSTVARASTPRWICVGRGPGFGLRLLEIGTLGDAGSARDDARDAGRTVSGTPLIVLAEVVEEVDERRDRNGLFSRSRLETSEFALRVLDSRDNVSSPNEDRVSS